MGTEELSSGFTEGDYSHREEDEKDEPSPQERVLREAFGEDELNQLDLSLPDERPSATDGLITISVDLDSLARAKRLFPSYFEEEAELREDNLDNYSAALMGRKSTTRLGSGYLNLTYVAKLMRLFSDLKELDAETFDNKVSFYKEELEEIIKQLNELSNLEYIGEALEIYDKLTDCLSGDKLEQFKDRIDLDKLLRTAEEVLDNITYLLTGRSGVTESYIKLLSYYNKYADDTKPLDEEMYDKYAAMFSHNMDELVSLEMIKRLAETGDFDFKELFEKFTGNYSE